MRSFFTALLFLVTNSAFALPSPFDPWCLDRELSLNNKRLQCLKSLTLTAELKRNFEEVSRRRKSCPKCEKTVVDEDENASFFESPFIVVQALYPQGGPGFDLNIVFKDRPNKIFVANLDAYEDGREGNRLAILMELHTTKREAALIKNLQKKEFDKFWIRAGVPELGNKR